MKLINRTKYLSELKSIMGTPDIKVITGVRRSGKSKLMEAFVAEVARQDPEANIIHVTLTLPSSNPCLSTMSSKPMSRSTTIS